MGAALGARRTLVLLITMTATSVLAVSTAQAWMTAQGSGSGTARSTSAPLELAVAPTGDVTGSLLPGGSGDLVLTIGNPNDFPVRITSVTASGPAVVSGAVGTCPATSIDVAVPAAQLPITIPAGASGARVRFTGAALMAQDADTGCQGASFRIPLALGARR